MALALAGNAPINEMRSPGLIGFPLLLLRKNGHYFSKKLRPKFQYVWGTSSEIRQLPWPCVNQNGGVVRIFAYRLM